MYIKNATYCFKSLFIIFCIASTNSTFANPNQSNVFTKEPTPCPLEFSNATNEMIGPQKLTFQCPNQKAITKILTLYKKTIACKLNKSILPNQKITNADCIPTPIEFNHTTIFMDPNKQISALSKYYLAQNTLLELKHLKPTTLVNSGQKINAIFLSDQKTISLQLTGTLLLPLTPNSPTQILINKKIHTGFACTFSNNQFTKIASETNTDLISGDVYVCIN